MKGVFLRFLLTLTCLLGLTAFFSGNYTVKGQVRDYDTGAPIEGAQLKIAVMKEWDILGGTSYKEFSGITDKNGNFKIANPVNDIGQLRDLHKDGYAAVTEGFFSASTLNIFSLKKITGPQANYRLGFFWIGVRQGKPFGWNFSRNEATEDPMQADIFPSHWPDNLNSSYVTFSSNVNGGLAFQRFAHPCNIYALNMLQYSDRIPQQLTMKGMDIHSSHTLSDEGRAAQCGLLFLKTADAHYAEIPLDGQFPGPMAGDKRSGNLAVSFPYLYFADCCNARFNGSDTNTKREYTPQAPFDYSSLKRQ